MYYFESSICRESENHPWKAFIQISDDGGLGDRLISSMSFDVTDLDATYNEMCAYFLTHSPEVIATAVLNCCVRNEIRDAAYQAWNRNRQQAA